MAVDKKVEVGAGEVGGEACLECHPLIHSGTAGAVGLPADRPAGSQWALVGWQWVRPANQRITGVGERCSSPLSLGGHSAPAAGQGALILSCPAF